MLGPSIRFRAKMPWSLSLIGALGLAPACTSSGSVSNGDDTTAAGTTTDDSSGPSSDGENTGATTPAPSGVTPPGNPPQVTPPGVTPPGTPVTPSTPPTPPPGTPPSTPGPGTDVPPNASTSDSPTSDEETTTPPTPTACATPSPRVTLLDTTTIADLGTPFDADEEDTIGPADWNSNYGKAPELVVHSAGSAEAGGFDVLLRDTTQDGKASIVHVDGTSANGVLEYAVTRAYQVETLGQLMGLTRDDEGNYYYASGVDEDAEITVESPAEGEFRPDIVRLVKFDVSGCVLWETDVDMARGEKDDEAEPIVNPMVAATSRLAWGGGQLALVHGINTAPDDNGTRHQKALTTHFEAATGAISRTSGLWVSHSFDQRLFWDGQGFVDLHLGDAYPRSVVMSRSTESAATDGYELYLPKGETGDNATYTQLGAIVPIATGDYGYWVLFATDRSPDLATEDWQGLVGQRDVVLTRVRRDFASSKPNMNAFLEDTGTVHSVTSAGNTVDNPVRWLTDFGTSGGGSEIHAARVRAVARNDQSVVVMWEQWEPGERRETYTGTYALELDLDAAVVTSATKIGDNHIPRGDDAFVLDGQAALVLGDAQNKRLVVQLVGDTLEPRMVVLP